MDQPVGLQCIERIVSAVSLNCPLLQYCSSTLLSAVIAASASYMIQRMRCRKHLPKRNSMSLEETDSTHLPYWDSFQFFQSPMPSSVAFAMNNDACNNIGTFHLPITYAGLGSHVIRETIRSQVKYLFGDVCRYFLLLLTNCF